MSKLKHQAIKGVRWTAVTAVVTTILYFIQIIVLGRLLRPDDFGLMAILIIVIEFAKLLGDVGLSEAVIQKENANQKELYSLFWLNIIGNTAIYCIILLLSPVIASLFHAPKLIVLLPITGMYLLIISWGTLFHALTRKALQFKILAQIEIASSAVGVIIAISSAFLDQGIWALIWGYLSSGIVRTVLFVNYGLHKFFKPIFYFCWKEITDYWQFGIYRVGAMIINYFNSRVDQLLIGILLGTHILGYYTIATQIVLSPIQRINPILTKVAFPIFAQIQKDTSRLRSGYFHMIKLIMFFNAPLLIGLATIASLAIPFLLGEQWQPAVPIVQTLSFYALLRSLINPGSTIILAEGHANWTFYWNLTLMFLIPPVIYFASITGNVINVAWALLTLSIFLFLAHYFILLRRIIGHCFKSFMTTIMAPVVLAIMMSLILILIKPFIENLHNTLEFLSLICIGVISYAAFALLFQKDYCHKILKDLFLE